MQKTIIITGASSGLGKSIALEYAKNKHNLFLFSRSKDKLESTKTKCLQYGSKTSIIAIDVTDEQKMQSAIMQIIAKTKIDIVIACAGVSAGTAGGAEDMQQIKTIFDVNIYGVINTITPIIPHMIKNKSGNIAIISSMASLAGISSAPSYSASKGAVRLYSDAISSNLKKHGVTVTTVIPGYIKTPMTDVNDFPMPFLMSAEKAAQKIIHAINTNKQHLAFPLRMYFIMKILGILPMKLFHFINSKLPGKNNFPTK